MNKTKLSSLWYDKQQKVITGRIIIIISVRVQLMNNYYCIELRRVIIPVFQFLSVAFRQALIGWWAHNRSPPLPPRP